MTRREDWLARLWETIEAWKDRPFEWGSADCCKFAAACVDAMTGETFAERLRYSTQTEALRWIAEAGSLQDAVSDHLGEPQLGYPRRGDVVLLEGEDGGALGICTGDAFLGFREAGLVRVAYGSRPHWRI